MFLRKFVVPFAAAGMLCLTAISVEASIIDDFSDPGTYGVPLVGAGSSFTLDGPAPKTYTNLNDPVSGTISGNRSAVVQLSAGNADASLTSRITPSGLFNFFLGGDTSAGTFQLSYGGGAFSADFTGDSIFSVDVAGADVPAIGTLFTMLLQDTSNVSDSVDVTLAVGGIQTLYFDFSGTLVDLTAVKLIQLSGSVPADGDIQISRINGPTDVPVPEPASLVLWGLMGAGLIVYRRRTAGRQRGNCAASTIA
jgi:hypothetical protein